MKAEPDRVQDDQKGLCGNALYQWVLSHAAEDESEPEEEDRSGKEDTKEPRDSGCFESQDNLESGREESKMEETEKEEQESEQTQPEQLEAVQEQLQELTVDEGQ